MKRPRLPRAERKVQVPEGIWVKCDGCKEIVYKKEVVRNLHVCPKCSYHFRLSVRDRLVLLFDEGEFQEVDRGVLPSDPLGFRDKKSYRDRVAEAQKRTGREEAVVNVMGTMGGIPVMVCCLDFQFLGGSMGSVMGEKITRAIERCLGKRLPLILVSASGGARMQEGALSLMQMAKVSAALARLDEARLPFLSVLTDPTTGGVSASFAMLGDVNLAEPKALIGFAGPRVIEQTIKETLPEGFQRSEFLLGKGMLDMVVERKELKATLVRLLRAFLGTRTSSEASPAAEPA